MSKKSIALISFSLLLLSFAYYTLLHRIEPFMYQFYLMAWWSYICFLDAILSRRTGRFLVLNKDFVFLVTMSAAFWCIFEVVNVRLQNWFYVNVPGVAGLRFAGYFLAYGTVIPAIYLTTELFDRILPITRIPSRSLKNYPRTAVALGTMCLVSALVFPAYFFAFAWVFLAFIVDGYSYYAGYPSFAASIERGEAKPLLAAGLSGMACGFLWEFWNYWSITKWVYTVPFFEDFKVFEMPGLGFLGFAFFAVETMAFLGFLRSSPVVARSKRHVSALAAAFCLASFLLIDHYTVFSHTARIEQLSFLTDSSRAAVDAAGTETSYAVDPDLLGAAEREQLALLHLKGLGLPAFTALTRHGVNTIARLADLDQDALSEIIQEKNMRRVRVYLKAAKRLNRESR